MLKGVNYRFIPTKVGELIFGIVKRVERNVYGFRNADKNTVDEAMILRKFNSSRVVRPVDG